MGLIIVGSKVIIDHKTNEHLITTQDGNPKRYRVQNSGGELDVFSIYTRLKQTSQQRRERDSRKIGDNCPLIYALKGKDQLTTGYQSIRELLINGRSIVANNFQPLANTILVPIPSSHSIVGHLTHELSILLNLSINENLLKKASMQSALADLDAAINANQSYTEKKELRNARTRIAKSEAFALKDVPTKYREVIRPIVAGPGIAQSALQSVVLVDDLVATGTSLISAKNILLAQHPGLHCSAVTLFSNV